MAQPTPINTNYFLRFFHNVRVTWWDWKQETEADLVLNSKTNVSIKYFPNCGAKKKSEKNTSKVKFIEYIFKQAYLFIYPLTVVNICNENLIHYCERRNRFLLDVLWYPSGVTIKPVPWLIQNRQIKKFSYVTQEEIKRNSDSHKLEFSLWRLCDRTSLIQ